MATDICSRCCRIQSPSITPTTGAGGVQRRRRHRRSRRGLRRGRLEQHAARACRSTRATSPATWHHRRAEPRKFPPYPSLHRPELINYWVNQIGPTNWNPGPVVSAIARGRSCWPADCAAADRICDRPPADTRDRRDHPNFTGSNPNPNGFDPINGPWDVDNDGDGVTDSVWVDLGLPVQTAPDGTTYKPLFAIRVLDMDGRLNVNAHGNSAQIETAYASRPAVTRRFAGDGAGSPAPNPLSPQHRGGNGSNCRPLIAASARAMGPPRSICCRSSSQQTPTLTARTPLRRPRSAGTSISLAGNAAASAAAALGTAVEGDTLRRVARPSADDARRRRRTTRRHSPSASDAPLRRADDSAPTHRRQMTGNRAGTDQALGFSVSGLSDDADRLWIGSRSVGARSSRRSTSAACRDAQLVQRHAVSVDSDVDNLDLADLGGQYDTLNNPYLLNLSRSTVRGSQATGATDNPFTPAELERLLRAYDADAGALAPRLATLLDTTSAAPPPTGKLPLGN